MTGKIEIDEKTRQNAKNKQTFDVIFKVKEKLVFTIYLISRELQRFIAKIVQKSKSYIGFIGNWSTTRRRENSGF